MEEPHGFISKKFSEYVCKLKKALYDLKQTPRAWYSKIFEYFLFCGFYHSNSDPSPFLKLNGFIL